MAIREKVYIGVKAKSMGFDAHLTMIFLGSIDEERIEYIEQIIKDKEWSNLNFTAVRKKIDMFGFGVPVVTVEIDPALSEIIRAFEMEYGISGSSEYSYNPHITLKFKESSTLRIPETIVLTDMYVG